MRAAEFGLRPRDPLHVQRPDRAAPADVVNVIAQRRVLPPPSRNRVVSRTKPGRIAGNRLATPAHRDRLVRLERGDVLIGADQVARVQRLLDPAARRGAAARTLAALGRFAPVRSEGRSAGGPRRAPARVRPPRGKSSASAPAARRGARATSSSRPVSANTSYDAACSMYLSVSSTSRRKASRHADSAASRVPRICSSVSHKAAASRNSMTRRVAASSRCSQCRSNVASHVGSDSDSSRPSDATAAPTRTARRAVPNALRRTRAGRREGGPRGARGAVAAALGALLAVGVEEES